MRVGIFPGSFDPIHNGHIELAQCAANQLELDLVIFVPSGVSPNKRRKQKTPGAIRHRWITAALGALKDGRLNVSDHESKHDVPTYTLETIEMLTAKNNENFLLVGADTAERMKRWPSYKRILEIVKIVSFGREGTPGSIETPLWAHSSTEVRERILKNLPVDHLVPASTAQEITKHFVNAQLSQAQS